MANRILRTWNDRLRSTCLEAWKSYTETCRRAKNEERIHGEMVALKDECAAPRSAPPRPCRPQGAGRVSDHTARAARGSHASSSLTSPRSPPLLPLCRYAKAVEEMKAKELSAAEKEAIKQERMAQRLFGKLQVTGSHCRCHHHLLLHLHLHLTSSPLRCRPATSRWWWRRGAGW